MNKLSPNSFIQKRKDGAALVLTLGILALITLMAVAFATMMRSEEKSGRNALYLIQARELASAGLNHAIAVLEADLVADKTANDLHDSMDENWVTDLDSTTTGDPDLDENGLPDSQWIYVHEDPLDATTTVVGRYVVLIQDEAGKVNLNTAGPGAQNEGWTPYEISLSSLFSTLSITSTLADAVVDYREGPNLAPGESSSDPSKWDDNKNDIALCADDIDNDADGSSTDISEGYDSPTEFDPEFPYDDDRPFAAVEELNKISGFGDITVSTLKNYATVTSYDTNKYWDGSQWARKININHLISTDQLYSLDLLPSDEKYRLAANIIDYADRDYYPTMTTTNVASPTSVNSYLGLEGLQINEICFDPTRVKRENDENNIGSDNDVTRSGGWTFNSGGSTSDTGTDGAIANWSWPWDNATYNITIAASTDAGCNGGITYTLESGEAGEQTGSLTAPITVNNVQISGDKINLRLQAAADNPSVSGIGVSYFDSIEIQAGKFVEIINISQKSITLDATTTNWIINFGGTVNPASYDGFPATVSGGTSINLNSAWNKSNVVLGGASGSPPTYQYLVIADSVFALDAKIPSEGWVGNDDGHWTEGGTVLAISSLNNIFTNGSLNLILADSSNNRVVAFAPSSTSFNITTYGWPGSNQSSSRRSPVNQQNSWDNTSSVTPGRVNANASQSSSGQNRYWSIKDRPYASIGEIGDVFLGTQDSETYAYANNVLDKITVAAKRLEAENADPDPITMGWALEGFATDNDGTKRYIAPNTTGSWTWGWPFDYKTTTGMNKPFRLISGTQFNALIYGQFGINFESPTGTTRRPKPNHGVSLISPFTVTSTGFISIPIKASGVQPKFNYVVLTPEPYTIGKININTAPKNTLQSLKGITSTIADNIISHRNSNPFNNIHELTSVAGVDESIFKPISNLITVRSDVYRVIVQAQRIVDVDGDGVEGDASDQIVSTAGLDAVVDRNPSMRFPNTTNRYRIESIKYRYN